MSYLLPKRISELASIDSDLDTPDKPREKSAIHNNYRLPKRVADLDLQESDSEDDKNDRLNCAILNDSFVLSPSKDIDSDTPCKPQKSQDENNKNFYNRNQTVEDKAFADSGFTTEPPIQDESLLKMSYRPIKSRLQLFTNKSVLQDKTQELSIPSVFQKSHQKPMPEVMKNSKVESENKPDEAPKVAQHETPFKKADEPVFATPSIRPHSFSLTAIKRSIHQLPLQTLTCERKDKPPAKILFTTPIARPPPGSLVESTPIEMRMPSTVMHRKLSPIREPSTEKEKPDERTLTINSNEYIIKKKIGSGGSSSVFLACGKKTGKECAIKLVNLDGDQQVIDGYLNETKLLAKLQGNITVVSLFDYCHLPEKNTLYMVMEKGDSDLHKILQGYKNHIPLYTLVSYWYQMLQAVNYIHQNGVIHSDLKPANFLMIEGRLKLIDFGIASNIAIDSTSIIKFSQAGTFNYISPEALIDTSTGDSPSTHHQPKIRLSTKSDVWSLGCILYLLLYKKTPFSHIKVLHHKIQALTNPNTTIDFPEVPNFYPPVLVDMTRKCLVYNPKERSSVADLLKYPFEMLIPLDK